MDSGFCDIINSFLPLGLEDLGKGRLMDRVDTKFVFSVSRLPALFDLMDGRYRILEVNGQRICNYANTYLDTDDYLFFKQHVKGIPERYKIRFRRYGSTGLRFLEVKKRTKRNRTVKWRREDSSEGFGIDSGAMLFLNSHMQACPSCLTPVQRNSFRRITFVCPGHPERITIDFDISYLGMSQQEAVVPWLAIAELKSEGHPVNSPFRILMKKIMVYPTGFSKYCVGNALLYNLPLKNILKPKLLLINKLENEYNGYACN